MSMPQENRFTLADVQEWDETIRSELIEGYPVMMAPPRRIHQRIVSELNRQLANFLKGKKCSVYPAPFAVRLFEKEGDSPYDVDTMVEPDISVVCDSSKLDDIGCKGAPDFIIEILSPSSLRHDRVTKFNLYRQTGVKEYWIVDPDNKTVETYILENGYYVAQERAFEDKTLKVNVLEGCVIDLKDVFGG